jgi:hypothetical protein
MDKVQTKEVVSPSMRPTECIRGQSAIINHSIFLLSPTCFGPFWAIFKEKAHTRDIYNFFVCIVARKHSLCMNKTRYQVETWRVRIIKKSVFIVDSSTAVQYKV